MSAVHLGSYNTSSTRTHVRFQFPTFAAAGGNVAPGSAFEAADIRIYKATDGAAFSATQRSSSSGITMTSPFDSLTGYHDVDIDLTDNTDAGFYAAGCFYCVTLAPDTETIDGQTITGIPLAYFEIGVPAVNASQINGVSTSSVTSVNANVGTTQPTNFTGTGGSALVKVDAIDWASGAIPNPNVTGVPLIDAKYLLGTIFATPNTAGLMDVNMKQAGGTAWASGAITAASIASSALTAAKFATDAIDSNALAASAVTEIQSGLSTLTGAQAATAVWQDTTSGDFTIAGSIGKSLNPGTLGTAPGAAGGFLKCGSNAAITFASIDCTGNFAVTGSWSVNVDTILNGNLQIGGIYNGPNIKADLQAILATQLTETSSGRLTAAFKKLFDVPTPMLTAAGVDQTGDSYARIGATGSGLTTITGRLPSALVGGRMDSSVGAVAAGAISDAAFAADTGLQTIRSGTCQGTGNTVVTVKLDSGASSTDNFYASCWIYLTGGTGAGQVRRIASYDGTTKIATIDSTPVYTWLFFTVPDGTTTFAILPDASVAIDAMSAQLFPANFSTLQINGITGCALVDVRKWVNSDVNNLQSGRVDSYTGAMGTDVVNSTALAASAVSEIQSGLSTLDAAGVRAAVGLASANLDTQLSGVPAAVWASGSRTLTAGTNIQLSANALALITQIGPARTLPGQGTPTATPRLDEAIDYLYKLATNPVDVDKDTGFQQYYNRAGSTVDHKRTVSDDGTTFSMGALATGP